MGTSSSRILLGIVIGAALLSMSGAGPALSCSCAPPLQVSAEVLRSAAVFSGIPLARIEPSGEEQRFSYMVEYVIAVVEVWKGQLPDTVRVRTARNEAACGVRFELGLPYLVYAVKVRGALETSYCDRTGPLPEVAADIEALGAPPSDPGSDDVDLRYLTSLVELAKAGLPEERKAAIRDLAWATERSPERVQERVRRCILDAVRDESPKVRGTALYVLTSLEHVSEIDPQIYSDAFADTSGSVRSAALHLIVERNSRSETAHARLRAGLADSSARVRATAVRLLPRAGIEGDAMCEVLLAALADPSPEVRIAAVQCPSWAGVVDIGLQACEPDSVVPLLAELLPGLRRYDQDDVLRVLQCYGPRASGAVPSLVAILDADEIPWYRLTTTFATIGPAAKAALPKLRSLAASGKRNRDLEEAIAVLEGRKVLDPGRTACN